MKFLENPTLAHLSAQMRHVDVGDRVIRGKVELFSCTKTASERRLSETVGSGMSSSSDASSSSPTSMLRRGSGMSISGRSDASPTAASGSASASASASAGGAVSAGVSGGVGGVGGGVGQGGLLMVRKGREKDVGQFGSSSPKLTVHSDPSHVKEVLVNLISTLNQSFPDYDFSTLTADKFVLEADLNQVVHSVNCNLAIHLERQFGPHFMRELWTAVRSCVDLSSVEVYRFQPDEEDVNFNFGTAFLWSTDYFFVDKSQGRILVLAWATKSKLSRLQRSESENSDAVDMSDDSSAGGDRPAAADEDRLQGDGELAEGEYEFMDDDNDDDDDDRLEGNIRMKVEIDD